MVLKRFSFAWLAMSRRMFSFRSHRSRSAGLSTLSVCGRAQAFFRFGAWPSVCAGIGFAAFEVERAGLVIGPPCWRDPKKIPMPSAIPPSDRRMTSQSFAFFILGCLDRKPYVESLGRTRLVQRQNPTLRLSARRKGGRRAMGVAPHHSGIPVRVTPESAPRSGRKAYPKQGKLDTQV